MYAINTVGASTRTETHKDTQAYPPTVLNLGRRGTKGQLLQDLDYPQKILFHTMEAF